MALKTIEERRKAPRVDWRGRVELNLPNLQTPLAGNSLNMSEEGMCLRLQEALEVRSRVRLRLFTESSKKPVECTGRVAWVMQRLDLRNAPPFLYDVGVQFIDRPGRFRQFADRAGVLVKPSSGRAAKESSLQPSVINGRSYVPRLQQESSSGPRWHLIVTVDGAPCFSHRYASVQEAADSWAQFRRHAERPSRSGGRRPVGK